MIDHFYSWDKAGDGPLYKRLADYVISLIDKGLIVDNNKLPSERRMATVLKVSRNTVVSALSLLEQKGVIITKTGSGSYIKDKNTEQQKLKTPKWNSYLNRSMYKPFHKKVDGRGNIKLNLSNRIAPEELNFINNITGVFSIKNYTKKYFKEKICERLLLHGINATPNNILLVPSLTQGINVVINTILGQGVNFYYDQFSYINYRSNIHDSKANLIPLPYDNHGLNIDSLMRQHKTKKHSILHLHTSEQVPTGVKMSKTRRDEIYNFCACNGIPIIETDNLRDVWTGEPPISPMKSIDVCNNVIYMGNLARSTSDEINLCWIVADPFLIERFKEVMLRKMKPVSKIDIMYAAHAFDSGYYEKYIERLRGYLTQQNKTLSEIMKKYLSEYATWVETGGYYYWPKFNENINTKLLYKNRASLDFNPGHLYDITGKDSRHISICTISLQAIYFEEAFAKLTNLIKKKL